MENNAKGAKFLKITGILMIIGAGLGIILSFVAMAGMSVLEYAAATVGTTINIGLYWFAIILALVGGVIELVTGIVGVKNAKVPEKANTCMICGIIVAAISVLSNVLSAVAYSNGFSVVSLVTGLVIPVLFIIGAVLNKQS